MVPDSTFTVIERCCTGIVSWEEQNLGWKVYPKSTELRERVEGHAAMSHEYIWNKCVKGPTLARRILLWVRTNDTIHPRGETTYRWRQLRFGGEVELQFPWRLAGLHTKPSQDKYSL